MSICFSLIITMAGLYSVHLAGRLYITHDLLLSSSKVVVLAVPRFEEVHLNEQNKETTI